MKAFLKRAATWLDALSSRERLLVFGASVGVLFLFVMMSSIDPSMARTRDARNRLAAATATQQALDAQKRELDATLRTHPDDALRARLAAADEAIGTLDRDIQTLGGGLASPARMHTIVRELVARTPRVTLASMRNLPPAPLEAASEIAPGEAKKRVAADASGELYRHGIEVTVEGSWPDLVEYASHIEGLPVRVLWDRTRIDATGFPRVSMTLTLYTLSLERTWLTL
jgi:MSHA biogenesis protein MshJ